MFLWFLLSIGLTILSFTRLFFLLAVPWFLFFRGLRKNIYCGFGRNIGQNLGGAQRNCPKPGPWRGSPCRCCSRLLFCVFANLKASSLTAFSSPCTPASSFLLPGCSRARRLQRLPLCIEPAPNVYVASGDFVSETAWLMHLCFYCEASVFWRFAASDLSQQTLEVGVYHMWRFHLLVNVFESQLAFVLSVLGQLWSC